MKQTVSRIIETTSNGAQRLDEGLQRLAQRRNVLAVQYAVAPLEAGHHIVKVQCTVPVTDMNAKAWFENLTRSWLTGVHIFEIAEAEVRRVD